MNSLKKVRIVDKEISQYELSRISSIPQSRLSLLENDLVEPNTRERKQLAEALGVSAEELFGEHAKPEVDPK